MIEYLIDVKKFIPYEYHKSIYDIPYDKLYEEGCRIILTDLDNTLISYQDSLPNNELFIWKKQLEKIGYEIIVISNSRKKRVKKFSEPFGVKYQSLATKPLKRGYKKALKKASKKYINREVLFIGDQLITDVYGAARLGYRTILVEAIKRKTERLITKINRKMEIKIIKKIKKKYPNEYTKSLKEYAGEHYGL